MKTEHFSLVNQLRVELKGVKSPFAIKTIYKYLRFQYAKTFCDGIPAKYFDLKFEVSAIDSHILKVMSEAIQSCFDTSRYDGILDIRVTEYELRDSEFVPTDIEFDVEDNVHIGIVGARAMLQDPLTIDLDAVSVYMSSQWHDQVELQMDVVTGTDAPQLRKDIDPRWVEFYTTTDPCRDIKYQDAYLRHSWDWRGYCVNHELTESQAGDLLDLVCWAIDNEKDYDEFILGTPSQQTTHKTETTNNNNITQITTMEQNIQKPTDWKMAPATPTTDLEQTYKEKFEAAFAIVLDPESNTTLGDMPRTWSYRGGKNNVIVCTVTDIAELTYEVQFGKRTQYVTHNDVRYNFASVPNMKKALEECFDEDGNATADIWQYCQNKPKATPNSSAAPKTAPKAETKTKKKEVSQLKQTEQPQAATMTMQTDRTYGNGAGQYYHIFTNTDGELDYIYMIGGECQSVRVVPNGDYNNFIELMESNHFSVCDTPQAILVALGKTAPMSTKAAEPKTLAPSNPVQTPTPQPTPTPEVEQPKAEEPKAEQPTAPKAEEIKAEEPKVIPLTLPDTITVGTLKNGSVTLSGLTDLTAEQIAIFVAGMNAMKEAIKKQMAI